MFPIASYSSSPKAVSFSASLLSADVSDWPDDGRFASLGSLRFSCNHDQWVPVKSGIMAI
jgi:hypothetical protein